MRRSNTWRKEGRTVEGEGNEEGGENGGGRGG